MVEKILREGGFDVIHYHNISLVGGLDVLAAGQAVKLYTLQEYWLICPTQSISSIKPFFMNLTSTEAVFYVSFSRFTVRLP